MPALGPGPGAYLLPPTVGYKGHDPSKYRNPMYSMTGSKKGFDGRTLGPGPTYLVKGFDEHGQITAPTYSIKSRPKELKIFKPPGPGTYTITPPKATPAYSMRARHGLPLKNITPGPDHYMLPTTIGPKVPDKAANPGYSMVSKHFLSDKERSPGPAKYGGLNLNTVISRPPIYSMVGRNFMPGSKTRTPGPAAYLPNRPRSGTGGFPFGMRTNNSPYITAQDEMPCIKR